MSFIYLASAMRHLGMFFEQAGLPAFLCPPPSTGGHWPGRMRQFRVGVFPPAFHSPGRALRRRAPEYGSRKQGV